MTWGRRSIFAWIIVIWAVAPDFARADFQVCNDSHEDAYVAVGYFNNEDYLTRGWWQVPANGCLVIYPGPLKWPSYYVYAETATDEYGNYDVWSGNVPLCVHWPNQFEITGNASCETQFFEIEAGESETMTFRLE